MFAFLIYLMSYTSISTLIGPLLHYRAPALVQAPGWGLKT